MRELEQRRVAEKAAMDRQAQELADQKRRESEEQWKS